MTLMYLVIGPLGLKAGRLRINIQLLPPIGMEHLPAPTSIIFSRASTCHLAIFLSDFSYPLTVKGWIFKTSRPGFES